MSDFVGGSSAARPSSEAERMSQARLPGPRTRTIILLSLGFVALLTGQGVALIFIPERSLERIAGWVLLVSGTILLLVGAVYLVKERRNTRSDSQTLFCTNDHDDHTKDSLDSP